MIFLSRHLDLLYNGYFEDLEYFRHESNAFKHVDLCVKGGMVRFGRAPEGFSFENVSVLLLFLF